MSTRTAYRPHIELRPEDDRWRVAIDCGFRVFVCYFDDLAELALLLDDAVRLDGLPHYAASLAYEKVKATTFADPTPEHEYDPAPGPAPITDEAPSQRVTKDNATRTPPVGLCWAMHAAAIALAAPIVAVWFYGCLVIWRMVF